MADLVWGAWQYGGGNGMRLGVQVYGGTGVTTDSTTWSFSNDFWTNNQYNYSGDSQTITYTGNLSGSHNYTNSQATGTSTLRVTVGYTYTYPAGSYGTSPGNLTIGGSLSGYYNSMAAPTVSTVVAIPARPYAAPTAPTSVTSVRNSDAQATVSWAHTATAQRPATSYTVQMSTYTGSTWSAWTSIYTGSNKSYAKTGLSANRIYKFQVRTNNSVGSSSYVAAAAPVHMTPAAPTSPAAAYQAGNTIKITWVNAAYTSATVTHKIERSVNGAAYAALSGASAIAQGTSTFTDSAPGAGSNVYRIAAVTSQGPLTSAWATTNTVTTIVPPRGPNQLQPDGQILDASGGVTLTWAHRHGGDGAPQSAFRIRAWLGGAWSVIADNIASTASTYTAAPGVLANGLSHQWQVQTIGILSGGYGPYSYSAYFTAVDPPAASLDLPGPTTNDPRVVAAWTYSQAQGHPQTGWEAELRSADGLSILEQRSGASEAETTFDYPVEDVTTYEVRVRVRSSDGLWSPWTGTTTFVDILPPAGTDMSGEYDECTATVQLSVTAIPDEPGVTLPTVTVDIYRRINGGPWVLVVAGLDVTSPVVISDTMPITKGLNEYLAVSWTDQGFSSTSGIIEVQGTDGGYDSGLWVFLSYGDGFSNVLRFHGDPAVDSTTTRERAAHRVAGRKLPVMLLGQPVGRELSVSGTLDYSADADCLPPDDCTLDSHRDDWERMSWEAEVVLYRDWTGRRTFGRLGSVKLAEMGVLGMAGLSLDVTEIDWSEATGHPPNQGVAPENSIFTFSDLR